MIFESLWPLFFLAAVPIIILLYLLKPKGVDYRISSNLLWKKLPVYYKHLTLPTNPYVKI
ncbi:MAG: BatA domain-containing protein, partial [Lachnospiraceae bacterium]|nr:BatA domain-containing protein [Lachnospiraceae bacterium]